MEVPVGEIHVNAKSAAAIPREYTTIDAPRVSRDD